MDYQQSRIKIQYVSARLVLRIHLIHREFVSLGNNGIREMRNKRIILVNILIDGHRVKNVLRVTYVYTEKSILYLYIYRCVVRLSVTTPV